MATKDLKEEYRKLLEENSQYEQLINQLKERLVFLDNEATEAERKLEEEIRVPHIISLERKKNVKQREARTSKNLETETQKVNDLTRRNSDHNKEVAFLLKRNNELKAEKKLDRQLTKQQTAVELQSGISNALKKRSAAEAKMLKTDDDKLQLKKEREELRIKAEHDKLQVFMGGKLQKVKVKKRFEILEQQELNKLRSKDVVGATGIDPNKMSSTSTQNKETPLSLTKEINEWEKKRSMLDERITKTKSDILVLKQEITNLDCQPEDLHAELENLTQLADALEEKKKVAEKTLDELAARNSRLLKDVQDILEERISNLLILSRVKDLQN